MTTTLINRVAPAEQHELLRAADSLFTEHSIATVTFTDVATRAGLDVAAVQDVFPTKRELLVAVLAYKHQGWVRRLERNGQKIEDPRDEILAVFTCLEECFVDTTWRGCCFVNAYAELGREDQGIADLAVEHFTEVERHMAALCLGAELPVYVSQALTILIKAPAPNRVFITTPAPHDPPAWPPRCSCPFTRTSPANPTSSNQTNTRPHSCLRVNKHASSGQHEPYSPLPAEQPDQFPVGARVTDVLVS
ncbi:TetR/AcrR family transcriptional regulator, partial [Frondihabitans sp. VKM Ac-2883]|uniref:TetR/AcrR family transcriptional regulator n=1 Tax=Frondihabitans sp. VKM Ac-2883 TaxID=2783823 RepID=UPI00188A603D